MKIKLSPSKKNSHSTKVLVVDDDPAITRMIKLNLEGTGEFEVKNVNESPAALAAATDFEPDIILLDVVMPEADGGDIAMQLRSNKKTKRIPILFVSAMVSKKEAQKGLYRSGGEHFLAKPVDTNILQSSIHTILYGSK